MLKEALMGLLATRPRHGYDLKLGLDELLGRTSPVNVGQVYTAVAKLEKDGLAEASYERDGGTHERKVYRLTPSGLEELHRWFSQPVDSLNLRNELFMKLSLARRTGKADAAAIIGSQRAACLRGIQELTSLRESLQAQSDNRAERGADVRLLIEGALLHLEADLKWLEIWEKHSAREADKHGG